MAGGAGAIGVVWASDPTDLGDPEGRVPGPAKKGGRPLPLVYRGQEPRRDKVNWQGARKEGGGNGESSMVSERDALREHDGGGAADATNLGGNGGNRGQIWRHPRRKGVVLQGGPVVPGERGPRYGAQCGPLKGGEGGKGAGQSTWRGRRGARTVCRGRRPPSSRHGTESRKASNTESEEPNHEEGMP